MEKTPLCLLRFFDKEEHALSFLDGEIRFGLLDRYRIIEGSRRDDKEGRVSFDWNVKAPQLIIDIETRQVVAYAESDQNLHYNGSSMNRYYILSTSHHEVNIQSLAEKFGPFIVRIEDPLAMQEKIKVAWQGNSLALESVAFIAPVVYNKDGLLDPDPNLIAPFHYSYSQKPSYYEDEKEFRYLLKCKVDTKRTWEDFLTLKLGNCRDICSLI